MIIHRADMFGLAQLYQLRGRIGRSKARAYAYLTLEPGRGLTEQAERRLEVLHKLDSLGAGFSLASHDLDIRGAGNLLGREQSGHIREVGVELYQHMIEQAVVEARARHAGETAPAVATWSPQINIGTAVLIPERYVADLSVRLSLYRRIASLESREEIDAFAAELADRFGPMPPEVEHLLEIVGIKQLCRRANVERLDGGPKGVAIAFRNNEFANPEALVALISDPRSGLSLRPDRTILLERAWGSEAERFRGVSEFVRRLGELSEEARARGRGQDSHRIPRAASFPSGLSG
jgi:transcription-repair coupling factor (superfamily II helicase)